MEKDIKRFRGCLKGIYKGIIDDKFMNYVIDNDIMFALDTDIEDFSPEILKHYSKNKLVKRIFYNNKIYDYNKDILLDMFYIIKQQVEYEPKYFEISSVIRKIKKGLAYLFDNEEKITFLKDTYKKQIGKLNLPEEFYWYCEYRDKPTFKNDKIWYEQENFCFQANIIESIWFEDYNFLNYLVLDNPYNLKFHENTATKWFSYHKTYHIIKFINDELKKLGYTLKKNKIKDNSSSYFNANQKTILIDLMFSQIDGAMWESMKRTKKAKLISRLIDGSETNIRTKYLPQLEKKNKEKSLRETINEMELFLNSLCSK